MRTSGHIIILIVAAHALFACDREKPDTATAAGAISVQELQPEAFPGTDAELLIQGTHVPVKLSQQKKDLSTTLTLAVHDEPFEVESYRSMSDSFELVSAAGETFTPPLDLLRFPLEVGSTWDWKGTMGFGSAYPATAVVTTANDSLDLGVPTSSIKVLVAITIEANGPDKLPAHRDLSFWFVPGKGVVKRDFGAGSIRQPLSKSQ